MNLLKPLYYFTLLFSGVASTFQGNPNTAECNRINCNAGKNSKSNTGNGDVVANYNTMEDYTRCGLHGIPFTIQCNSKFSAFLSINNCITRIIWPKNQCPPVGKGKGYYPSNKGYMDAKDLPKGCSEAYKKRHEIVKQAIMNGKKTRVCV